MTKKVLVFLAVGVLILLVLAVAWRVRERWGASAGAPVARGEAAAVAVEVGLVEQGAIRDIRELSGTLEASARFTVAPKVDGQILRMHIDIGDSVSRGALVAELDDSEFVQALAQAEAQLAVARANHTRAQSSLALSEREHERLRTLGARGIASESQLDEAAAALEERRANLIVTRSEVERAEAAVELARIQLGYTKVVATWAEGDRERIAAERFQDAGNNVQAGAPILTVVDLDPLTAVASVTERDYALLRRGQAGTLRTDAFPGETFSAHVSRLAPVFREASRQARVELLVDNADQRLKPGMFIRVSLILREMEDAILVPLDAITRREGHEVLFVLSEDGQTVRELPVRVGIVEGDRAQVEADIQPGDRVVTLGQHLLQHGARIAVAEQAQAISRAPAGDDGGAR